ncbi:hypothetical protein K504DRAFT_506587 [Pleomassaria siparia CBS 279.74]|uniref:Uncharacterized protein n=1 Tax=Pleomassaria siparia CBS 279.74 TaxID=1314801 RepID=A0A6G1JX47_9PLEO|nr:hypothetical protein K504DRAFT_506587 [Pleomassaria siparia CBS 279.74]
MLTLTFFRRAAATPGQTRDSRVAHYDYNHKLGAGCSQLKRTWLQWLAGLALVGAAGSAGSAGSGLTQWRGVLEDRRIADSGQQTADRRTGGQAVERSWREVRARIKVVVRREGRARLVPQRVEGSRKQSQRAPMRVHQQTWAVFARAVAVTVTGGQYQADTAAIRRQNQTENRPGGRPGGSRRSWGGAVEVEAEAEAEWAKWAKVGREEQLRASSDTGHGQRNGLVGGLDVCTTYESGWMDVEVRCTLDGHGMTRLDGADPQEQPIDTVTNKDEGTHVENGSIRAPWKISSAP